MGHVLRDANGAVLARWDIGGEAGSRGHTGNGGTSGSSGISDTLGLDSLGLGLGDSSSSTRGFRESLGLSSSSASTTGGSKASLGLTDPVLTIVGALPGVSLIDQRWVEFVVASGACVLKREEKDVKKVLKVLG